MSDREDKDGDAALAGEYVLRLLEPEAAAECAGRVARDPEFAALVAGWQSDLSGFDADFVAVAPPPALRTRIEDRLFGRASSPLARLWASAGLWRGVAAAALVAAAYFSWPIVERGPVPGHFISSVAAVDSNVGLLAYFDPQSAVLEVSRVSGAAAPGRALELWVIPESGAAPVSLGVLPGAARARVAVPRALAAKMGAGSILAVSDEAPGGSTTGVPGTVLAAGPIAEI